MLFDRVTAYTDENGVYRIKCLGPGEFAVHADATPWGYVKTRKLVTINDAEKTNRLNFTVRAGVPIHGKFVDENGKRHKYLQKVPMGWLIPRAIPRRKAIHGAGRIIDMPLPTCLAEAE